MYKIGDPVEDQYGEVGTIERVYSNFYDISHMIMNRQEWLDQQLIPFSQDELLETWYQVLVNSGGAINSCESKLKRYWG